MYTVPIRSLLLIFCLIGKTCLVSGQTSLKEIALDYGEYSVGFLHYTISDSTRTYSRIYDYSNEIVARPIPVSLWYPSAQHPKKGGQLKVIDYFKILKEEEEWEFLPDEQVLNWFHYTNTPANQDHLNEKTAASANLEFANGKFPVVIYTPSHQASSIENFAICEYLASYGYIIISSPSRGTETRWYSSNNAKEMETQARDVEFLTKEIAKFTVADIDKIAAMGFSFGGLSNMLVQMRNENIKAIVSLDGTERYQYALLQKSPYFDIEKLNVPYLHMAQKDIPEKVLQEDNVDAELNTRFELFDNVAKSNAYRLKFHDLTHSYFSSLGVLFEQRDKRQDKSDAEIMESYRWVSRYTLNFLNAWLKNDANAMRFMENEPSGNGIREGLITQSIKRPAADDFTFQDFNDLASGQEYENLLLLFQSIQKKNPSLKLPENNLNLLGLQLVFNPKTSEQGIRVLLLATTLYPNSANLFDSLAEAYLFAGDTEKAVENFKRSLELNPDNQNAIDRLKQLNN